MTYRYGHLWRFWTINLGTKSIFPSFHISLSSSLLFPSLPVSGVPCVSPKSSSRSGECCKLFQRIRTAARPPKGCWCILCLNCHLSDWFDDIFKYVNEKNLKAKDDVKCQQCKVINCNLFFVFAAVLQCDGCNH